MDNCNLTLALLVPKTHTSIPCCREVVVGSAVKRSRTMVDGKNPPRRKGIVDGNNHLTGIELQLYWFILPYVYSVRFVYQSLMLEKSSEIPLCCVVVPYLVMLLVVSWTIGLCWKNNLMSIDLALCWSTITFCFKLVVHQLPNVWITKNKEFFKSLKMDSKNKNIKISLEIMFHCLVLYHTSNF